MCWQSEGEAYNIERTEQRDRILEALKLLGRAQVNAIAEAVGEDRGNTFRRLSDMVNNDMIKRITEGKKVYYALPEYPEQAKL
jgi:DNA-binding IclR family transcriptional regulator